jgi:hypothetical protein
MIGEINMQGRVGGKKSNDSVDEGEGAETPTIPDTSHSIEFSSPRARLVGEDAGVARTPRRPTSWPASLHRRTRVDGNESYVEKTEGRERGGREEEERRKRGGRE